MSNLSAADRRALPVSSFGDPQRRLFPIIDQDDVISAGHLIGKAHDVPGVKARIIAIAKRKGLRIPVAWQTKPKPKGDFMKSVQSTYRAKKAAQTSA